MLLVIQLKPTSVENFVDSIGTKYTPMQTVKKPQNVWFVKSLYDRIILKLNL